MIRAQFWLAVVFLLCVCNAVFAQAPADINPNFVIAAAPNQVVRAVYVYDDGRVLVGGSFTNLAGDQRLTRYLANGAADPNFSEEWGHTFNIKY